MARNMNRRQFLETGAAAGVASLALPRGLRARSTEGKKVRHASIGVGGMGWSDLNRLASHPNVEVVAICDVDLSRAVNAIKKLPGVHVYQDWRELLRKEKSRIDSVNITIPDHMHASVALNALRLGKHVYCQKPLTHDVYEARRLTEAAARAGVVTQMGIQFSSSHGDRAAVRWIRDGVIGRAKKVFLWSNKDPWKYRPTGPRPELAEPARVPVALDWDKWLGTAPARPFVPEVYHPTFWRGWRDFGVGWLGDMGCHITDAPYRALDLGAPLTVRAEAEPEWRDTPGRYTETWPTWQIVHFTFPGNARTAGETIEVVWSDGFRYPPDEYREAIGGAEYPPQGALVLGEKGALLLPHGGEPSLYPQEDFQDHPQPQLPPRNHYHHFVDAILGGEKTEAGFDHSGPLTEVILLGTIALLNSGRELRWNAGEMKFEGDDEANHLLRRTYREGWQVEGL